MTLLSITRGAATVAPYGTDTFTAHLAAREAALGIAQTTQELNKSIPQPGGVTADATDLNPQDASPPVGDMGVRCDRWGNAITSAPRLDGAYTFTSRTWGSGGRTVFVCGSPAAHVAGGYWQLDGRMSAGQGYVCGRCWPQVARQWGIGREWRR